MARTPYSSPWARLTEGVAEEDGPLSTPCWIGSDQADRCGYQRVHCYIRGCRGEGGVPRRRLTAHALAFAHHHLALLGHGVTVTWDDLYLAVLELRASGCELDHECERPACRNPMHLVLRTPAEHRRLTFERWGARRAARAELADDLYEYALEF